MYSVFSLDRLVVIAVDNPFGQANSAKLRIDKMLLCIHMCVIGRKGASYVDPGRGSHIRTLTGKRRRREPAIYGLLPDSPLTMNTVPLPIWPLPGMPPLMATPTTEPSLIGTSEP